MDGADISEDPNLMEEATFLSIPEVEVVLKMLDKDRVEEYTHTALADTRDYVRRFNKFDNQEVKNLRNEMTVNAKDLPDYQATLLINLAPPTYAEATQLIKGLEEVGEGTLGPIIDSISQAKQAA